MEKTGVLFLSMVTFAFLNYANAATQSIGSGCEQRELVRFQSTIANCVFAVSPNTSPPLSNPYMLMFNMVNYGTCLATALLEDHTQDTNPPVPNQMPPPAPSFLGRKKRIADNNGKAEKEAGVKVFLCCQRCIKFWLKEINDKSKCGSEHYSSCFVKCLEDPEKKFNAPKKCSSLDYDDPNGCTAECKSKLTAPTDSKGKVMYIVKYATCFEKCFTAPETSRKKRYLMTNVFGAPQSIEAHTLAEYTLCSNQCQMNWLTRAFYAPQTVTQCSNLPAFEYLFCYWNCILHETPPTPVSYSWSNANPDLTVKTDIVKDTIVSRVEYIDCYSDCLLFHNIDYPGVDREAYSHPGSCVVEDYARSGKCMSTCLYGPTDTRNINNYNTTQISKYDKLLVTDCAADCWLAANDKEWCLVEELLNILQCINDCARPLGQAAVPEISGLMPVQI